MIAIVNSSAFDFGTANFDAPSATPAGQDLAEFFQKQLVAIGAVLLSAPAVGVGGWLFDIELKGGKYRIFVHWAPIGNPPSDRWVIQADVCKSLLRSLFGRQADPKEIQPLVNELSRVLETSEAFTEIRWGSREEFALLY